MSAEIFTPPPGACDCHLHVVGPKARYRLADHRAFTPMDAPLDTLLAMHQRIGIERMVLIQTSVFGYDNTCMLDALKVLGPRARGIAIVPENTDPETLDEMHRLGVRGLRVNNATYGLRPVEEITEQLQVAAGLCAPNNWHVQLFTPANAIAPFEAVLDALPASVSIDHFGLIPPQDDTHEAENVLHRLLEKGQVWVKISGAYRLNDGADNDFSDPRIGALARRLYQTNPARIVWGTDWPHTPPHGDAAEGDEEVPYRDIEPASLINALNAWFDDPKAMQRILVDNPMELYEF